MKYTFFYGGKDDVFRRCLLLFYLKREMHIIGRHAYFDDLTNKRFGKLTVKRFDHEDCRGRTFWLCECDCGNHVVRARRSLISDSAAPKSCGCNRREDLSGMTFGRLTVIELSYVDYNHISFWRCQCTCGNETIVRSTSLKNGMTTSCGCYRHEQLLKTFTKHNLCDHPLYVVWTDMKRRCGNINDESWHRYGGRGITVYDDWVVDFKAFYDWAIDNGWAPGLTLDRKNNDDGYNPYNCRFVDRQVQSNNRRSNRYFQYGGETNTIAQWSRILNIDYFRLLNRINNGNFIDFESHFGFIDPDGGDL